MFTDDPSNQPLCAMIFQLSLDYGYCPGITYSGYTAVDYSQPAAPGDLVDAGVDASGDAGEDAGAPDATMSSNDGSASTDAASGG
jgi:hypothetical protein